MKKEFVTYEQALALKELGYDKPCLGNYADDENHTLFTNGNRPGETNAPLYSQAFRWFREKYEYYSEIRVGCTQIDGGIGYEWWIWKPNGIEEWSLQIPGEEWSYETYEEAEQACLDELIEIIRNTKP